MQVCLLFFQKDFQLFHVESTYKLVFPLLKCWESIKRNISSHLPNDIGVETTSINQNLSNFFYVLGEEIQTFFHQSIYFQEIGRYQYRCGILVMQSRSIVELYPCLTAILCSLKRLAPFDSCNDSTFMLLLVFFLRQHILQQPFKDSGITVYGNVYFITIWNPTQTPFKILHILNQQTPSKGEIPLLFLSVIDDMDHDGILEISSLDSLSHSASHGGVKRPCWCSSLCDRFCCGRCFVWLGLLRLSLFEIGDVFRCKRHYFSNLTEDDINLFKYNK